MDERIRGVLPIVHTPFDDQQKIVYDLLQKEVDYNFENGANGVGMALASEILRMTFTERTEMGKKLVEFADGRGPVIIGVHGESTVQSLEYAVLAESCGAAAVMATPPSTGSWSLDGLFDHYAALVNGTNIPVIVQDGSAMVGRPMPIPFQARLRNELGERVLFKPEAMPVGPQFSQLRDATHGEAKIFEGLGGAFMIDSHRRGVIGSMVGSEMIDAAVAIWNAMEAGDEETAYRIHSPYSVLQSMQCATLDTLLAIEKHILVRRGIFENENRRTPNSFTLDPETRAEVNRLIDKTWQAMGK